MFVNIGIPIRQSTTTIKDSEPVGPNLLVPIAQFWMNHTRNEAKKMG